MSTAKYLILRDILGRQVITYLILCNLIMWIIYTFEFQKVHESPVQVIYNVSYFGIQMDFFKACFSNIKY